MNPIIRSSSPLNINNVKKRQQEDYENLYYFCNICLFGPKEELYRSIDDLQIKQINPNVHREVKRIFFSTIKSSYISNYTNFVLTFLEEKFNEFKLKPASEKRIFEEISKKSEDLAHLSLKKFENNVKLLDASKLSITGVNLSNPSIQTDFNLQADDFVEYDFYINSKLKMLDLKHAKFQALVDFNSLIKFLEINLKDQSTKITTHSLLLLNEKNIKNISLLEPLFIAGIRSEYIVTYVEHFFKTIEKRPDLILTPAGSERIYASFFDFSNKSAQKAFEGFMRDQKTISETMVIYRVLKKYDVKPEDFLNCKNSTQVDSRKKMFLERMAKKQADSLQINLYDNGLKSFKEANLLLKIFAAYIKENPDLNLFDDAKFEKARPKIREEILQAEVKAKEAAAKKAEQELLHSMTNESEPVVLTPKQVAKKRNSPQAPAPQISSPSPKIQKNKTTKVVNTIDSGQSELQALNRKLNSKAKCKVSLKDRVGRWSTSDLEEIRRFKDKTSSKEPVQHYINFTKAQLLEQQAFHNFAGIERLVSDELVGKYSFKYIPKPGSSGIADGRIGRCFYAKMHYNGKDTFGMVNLGISKENEIFHAMFSPIQETDYSPIKNFFSVAEKLSGEEIDEVEWKQVSSCTFEVFDNEIVMKVQRQNVRFTFYPLKADDKTGR